MRAITDVHFAIGKTHEVCEDYGKAGLTVPPRTPDIVLPSDPDFPSLSLGYAVISDGCSSSENTDFGARLVCRAAEKTLNYWARQAVLAGSVEPNLGISLDESVPWVMEEWALHIGLNRNALDATLLGVVETPCGVAHAFVYGDGIVAARRRDGSGYDYHVVTCSKNAPTYLSYLVKDPPLQGGLSALGSLQKQGGGYRTITTYFAKHPDDPIETVDDHWSKLRTRDEDPMGRLGLHWTFHNALYDVVVVISDGAESFQRREGTRMVAVPTKDVLDQIMGFKNTSPGFVRRRVKRFLTKFCIKNGWHHNDDLAVGGLVLEAPCE